MGGPGYGIDCENKGNNARKHFRGSLSMAHAGPNTGGSQFFLTFVPTYFLDRETRPPGHTVFGRVSEGIDVLADIQRVDPSDEERMMPVPDKILEAKVLNKRNHEYVPIKNGNR
jgi:cyclophilin family peptidyl-prolyl cis-trans isomerase